MDFAFQHRLPAPIDRVERALLDASLPARLAAASPALADAALLGITADGDAVERAAHFTADPAWITGPFLRVGAVGWTESVRWSRAAHSGAFRVEPDGPAALRRRVRCEGTYALEADGAATVRTVRGSIAIRAPLVGAAAEALVVARLGELFADEAALLAREAAGA